MLQVWFKAWFIGVCIYLQGGSLLKLSKLSSSYIVLCAPPILFLPFSHAIKKTDNWMKKNVTVEYVFIMAMRTNINDYFKSC